MNREESPLVIPENAVIIDNTNKTKEETIERNYREAKALVADHLLSFLIPFSDLIVFSETLKI